MIQNISKGKGFRGTSEYILNKPEAERLNCGTMAGKDPATLSQEAGHFRKMNDRLGKAVFHSSLSLHEEEKGKLNNKQWADIATQYANQMGFENAPWYAVKHNDGNCDHIHVIALRIDYNGNTVSDSQDFKKGSSILQKIEKDYGLIQGSKTPEQAYKMKEKGLSQGQVQQASRDSDYTPIKPVVQSIIKDTIKDNPTTIDFCERLKLAGVTPKPNVAKTGKMNGFSFEYNNVHFKGSDLGKAYTFKGLQENGLNYNKDRDTEYLKELKHEQVTRSKEQERVGSIVKPDFNNTKRDFSINNTRVHQQSNERVRIKPDVNERFSQKSERNNEKDKGFTTGVREGEPRVREQSEKVREDYRKSTERSGKSKVENIKNGVNNKHNNEFNNSKRNSYSFTLPITKIDIAEVKRLDPTPLFEAYGFTVRKEGHHLSIREGKDEVFRSTFKNDKWLHTRKEFGSGIGDNIELIKELEQSPDMPFIEAVNTLKGGPVIDNNTVKLTAYEPKPNADRLYLPFETNRNVVEMEQYLEERGISKETIEHADNSAFIYALDNGVGFVGYDNIDKEDWIPKFVDKRLMEPEQTQDGDLINKRCLKNSNATYVPCLPGETMKNVVIVEGGVDALAVHDIYKRRNEEKPTVIMTGGANNLKWLDGPQAELILKQADKVVMCHDNENTQEKQDITDKARSKQADLIKVKFGVEVETFRPDGQFKDIADQNKHEMLLQEKKRILEEENKILLETMKEAQKKEKQKSRGRGMEM